MNNKKVLIIFSNPTDTSELELIREEKIILDAIEIAKYKENFDITCVKASTIHDLRRHLLNEDFHIIQISTHGTNSGLILENDLGESHKIPQLALAELFNRIETIECVILNACFTINQGEIISMGVPYTIAMENKLDDLAAIEFSRGFYDAIGAGKTYKFAYEEGCLNVKLTYPDKNLPSVFFDKDELVFRETNYLETSTANSHNEEKTNEAQEKEQLIIGVPPQPDIFLGREDDIGILKERLGILKGGKDTGSIQMLSALRDPNVNRNISAIRGFTGIGKTATSTVFANDPDVLEAYPDGVLWSTLGQTPNIIHTMANWGSDLGSDEIYSAITPKQASERLSYLLSKKRMLIIIDDVWEVEHAFTFKSSTPSDCSLLITTRSPNVINNLSLAGESVHNLSGLSETHSLKLLEILAPQVVPDYPKECLKLVRSLENLPLALHVAGRLLNVESQEVWGVEELLESLQEGKMLIDQKAPVELMDLEKQAIPTVATLLRKSIDSLSPQAQLCFAFLAPYEQKPASFSLEALKASWQIEDPRPIIKELTGRGLLERVGNEYQMHSLLITLAKSLFES